MKRSGKLAVGLLLTLALTAPTLAAEVRVNGAAVACDTPPRIIGGATYVPLRAVSEALRGDSAISWDGRALVRAAGLDLSVRPGEQYLEANGRDLYIAGGARMESGRVLVPVRVLAKALGATVTWNAATGDVDLTRGSGAIASGDAYYNQTDLYWLSRIISAESQGEPLAGKIAVGNVVMNRVKSDEFPNTIHDVIFDPQWGGQFTPAKNGMIYKDPTPESVLAAKLCLDGANTVGDSLYFLAPALSTNFWIMNNRPHVATIGSHWFYN